MTTNTSMTIAVNITPCASCGGPIALERNQERVFRETHNRFYCPSGHWNNYPGESERERYNRLLGEERRASNQTEGELRQRNDDLLTKVADKNKEIKGLKKRSNAGMCPHCHRTFKQVVAHMKRKHPGEAVLEPVEHYGLERG